MTIRPSGRLFAVFADNVNLGDFDRDTAEHIVANYVSDICGAVPARLDVDRSAKPLTTLVHHPRYTRGGGIAIPGAASHLWEPELIDNTTGERTALTE